jgi:hypothetical protein
MIFEDVPWIDPTSLEAPSSRLVELGAESYNEQRWKSFNSVHGPVERRIAWKGRSNKNSEIGSLGKDARIKTQSR